MFYLFNNYKIYTFIQLVAVAPIFNEKYSFFYKIYLNSIIIQYFQNTTNMRIFIYSNFKIIKSYEFYPN